MPVSVQFDPSMSRFAPALEEMQTGAGTVQEILVEVSRRYPVLQSRLFNCEGELRSIIKVKKDGRPISGSDTAADGESLLLTLE